MAAIAPASDGSIERLAELPKPKAEAWLYDDLVSKHDIFIVSDYKRQWQWHETVSPYDFYTQQPEFHALGQRNSGRPITEADTRMGFAQGVLRLRLNSAVRTAFAPAGVLKAVRKRQEQIDRQLEQIRDTSISLAPEAEAPKLHYGYDLMSDFSKLELIAPNWSFGLYHSQIGARLTGGVVTPDCFLVRASAKTDRVTEASVTLVPGTGSLSGTIGRWIHPRVRAELTTSQPLVSTGISSYGMNFAYSL
jgi:hypothetical protein